ncbi:hypothetical protein L204_102540 [Cryptococcus depauperatus]|nr:hypothetical protein L204_00711 [Cryptococcus depauperatus CBS 7855]
MLTSQAIESITNVAPRIGRIHTRQFKSTPTRTARKNHYETLKLSKNASRQQVKAKFYELSKKYHPDAKSGDVAKFHEINDAYATLGNEDRRRQYDLSIIPASQSPDGPHAYSAHSHSSFRPNDPYLHRTAKGPHRAWDSHPSHPSFHPQTEKYTPFGRRTPHGTQYSYEYNYNSAANVRTTDRAGWGRRTRQSEKERKEAYAGGGGAWKFIITAGLIITAVALGGGLAASSESAMEWPKSSDQAQAKPSNKKGKRDKDEDYGGSLYGNANGEWCNSTNHKCIDQT